jgi:hypothetical protein
MLAISPLIPQNSSENSRAVTLFNINQYREMQRKKGEEKRMVNKLQFL